MPLSDPEISTQILTSRDFDVVDYADRYSALADRLGLDLSNILFALAAIPLCLRGAAHEQQRSQIARMIAARQPETLAALPQIVRRSFAGLHAPGRHDILNEAIIPAVDGTLSVMLQVPLDLTGDVMVSRIFSQAIGVAKRKRLDAELAGLRARFRAGFPDEDAQTTGMRIALTILGRDALIGTLGCTLHDHFAALAGRAATARACPHMPTRTGVPYIDRTALQTTEVAGAPVQAGETLRVRLDAYETRDTRQDQMKFFGAGAHTCLGRPVSLALWAAVAQEISQIDRPIRVVAFTERKDDVFRLPSEFIVEID